MANVAVVSGNLVATPELRVTNSNTPVCSFTVAVRRPKVKDVTDFIDCVAWRQTAEFISKYFQKGSAIEVTGPITTRTYEDKNGNKRKAVEVLVDNVSFSGHKKEEDSARTSFREEASTPTAYRDIPETEDFKEIPEEDLPF